MIIKKWDTTLNSGAGGWAEQYPKTVAQKIFDNAGTTSIFDINDRIKVAYLPNAVFDSLYFYQGVTLPSSTKPLAAAAIANALNVTSRSSLGYYWVVTTAGNLTASSTASLETLYTKTCTLTNGAATITTADTSDLRVGMIVNGSNIPTNSTITAINSNGTQFTISNNVTPSGGSFSLTFSYNISTFITGGEERQVDSTVETVGLEVGDWFIVSRLSGVGSIASPFIVTFAPVNNTYELMTGATNSANGAPGLVPTPLIANELQFLRGNGTWATPTNTTYAVSTANGDDIYKEKINLTGSDSSTDTVQIAVNATSLRTFTGLTTNGSTTIASVIDTAGLLVGQLVTGTGIPANALIIAINPNTSVTISIAATVNGGGTYTASTFGLTIEQASDIITIKHADTSSASNLASTARTYVSGLTFDTFGHVIGYTTGSETVVNTNTTYDLTVPESTTTIRLAGSDSTNDDVTLTAGTGMAITRNSATQLTFTPTAYTAGNGISLSSFAFSVGAGVGLTQEATGLKMTYPVYHGDTLPITGIPANAIGLEW
jgi:hypothetical protein